MLLISNVGSGTIIGKQASFDRRSCSTDMYVLKGPTLAGLVLTSALCNSN